MDMNEKQPRPMMPQAQQAQSPGGPMPPAAAGGGAQPMVSGEEVQGLLFSRINQMTPEEMQMLDSIITPKTLPMLFKLLPELAILFEQGSNLKGASSGPVPGGAQVPQQQDVNQQASRGLMGY